MTSPSLTVRPTKRLIFAFSLKVSVIGLLLITGMLRLSYWQWTRHLEKQVYIDELEKNFSSPPVSIESLIAKAKGLTSWAPFIHRRVWIEGEYDFPHEIILRNRRYQDTPGVHVITPLKIKDSDNYILINRGFLPLEDSEKESRAKYQLPTQAKFLGLIKESSTRTFFLAPADPPSGPGFEWVDAWLRIDIPNIEKQLPFRLLPVYLEIVPADARTLEEAKEQLIVTESGRDEMFMLPFKGNTVAMPRKFTEQLPIPTFNTIVPPGRHLGYVFEWGLMAFVTFLICLVIQFRRF